MKEPPPPQSTGRLILGLALLPPAAALLMFLTGIVMWRMNVWILEGRGSLDAAMSLGLGVGLLAIPMAIVAIFPIAWLSHRQQLTFPNLLTTGVVIANVPFGVIIASVLLRVLNGSLSAEVIPDWFSLKIVLRSVLLGVWHGWWLACLLWVVAIRGSGFEDVAPTPPTD